MKTLAKQRKQLTILFGNIVMKVKTETELIAPCHGGTEVKMYKTREIVGEILRVAHMDVCRKSRKNQGRVRTDTRKEADTN